MGTRAVGPEGKAGNRIPQISIGIKAKPITSKCLRLIFPQCPPIFLDLPMALGTRSLLGVVSRRVAPLKCPWTTLCTAKLKLLKPKVKHGKKKKYSYVPKHFDREKRSPKFKSHSVLISS